MHTVNRIMRCWDMAVWSFPRWPPAAILNLIQPEMAPFDPPSRKPHPRTKHEGDRLTRCTVMAIWNFPTLCELALRSVVGRWSVVGRSSVVNIHTSYTDLIYSAFAMLYTVLRSHYHDYDHDHHDCWIVTDRALFGQICPRNTIWYDCMRSVTIVTP